MKKFFLKSIVLGVIVLQSSALFATEIPISNASEYAKVDYYGYFTSNPVLYNKGKFEITCSKDGVIK
ncbi:MAG: hypothetical protein ACRCTE_12635 [Cellulosilyticaceae bacterium]